MIRGGYKGVHDFEFIHPILNMMFPRVRPLFFFGRPIIVVPKLLSLVNKGTGFAINGVIRP